MLLLSLLCLSAVPLARAFVPTTTLLDSPHRLLPKLRRSPRVGHGLTLLRMETLDKDNNSGLSTAATYTTSRWKKDLLSTALACSVVFASSPMMAAMAVSGGGLDYAGLDLSGQDFSNGNYKGKDFTQGECLGRSC